MSKEEKKHNISQKKKTNTTCHAMMPITANKQTDNLEK
jgi:hypothetical protein